MMIDSNGDIRIDCGHRARGNVLIALVEEVAAQLSKSGTKIFGYEVAEAIEAFERRQA